MEEVVARKIDRLWHAPAERQRAEDLLSRYGTEPFETERDRVQLAVLKLSNGELDELEQMVSAAKHDYRDVLYWAEYPEESKAVWAVRPDLSPEERKQLGELRERDRLQYLAWLQA